MLSCHILSSHTTLTECMQDRAASHCAELAVAVSTTMLQHVLGAVHELICGLTGGVGSSGVITCATALSAICRGKIVDGRIQKFLAEQALLEQAFIKDTTKTVATLIKEATATVGEKISIRRFERYGPAAIFNDLCTAVWCTATLHHCTMHFLHCKR